MEALLLDGCSARVATSEAAVAVAAEAAAEAGVAGLGVDDLAAVAEIEQVVELEGLVCGLFAAVGVEQS